MFVILLLLIYLVDIKRLEFEQKIARYKVEDKKRKELLENKVVHSAYAKKKNPFFYYFDYSMNRIFIHSLIGFVLLFLCCVGSWISYSIFEIFLVLIDYLIWEKGIGNWKLPRD